MAAAIPGRNAGGGRNRGGNRLEQRRGRGRRLVGVANQFQQVMIFDVLDLVGQPHKAAVDVIECAAVKLVAELFAANVERVTTGMLAQHQLRIGHAHGLRRHNLISQRILEHAVLVDSRLVREGVASGNSFIRLHGHAGNFAEHLAGGRRVVRPRCRSRRDSDRDGRAWP